ncbi:MAG: Uma2 family endonuclease [Nitrospirae bacterium]|nr:Uma2 family endonuclease [Nitrospirota bacterium]MBF0535837.1 Uma2 family endonuclease [Nitrospirota bacterium]MBF0617698.1 Uma2 family endonuclease [Nitrospirota bacterium]
METIERDLDLTEIINGEEIMGPSPFIHHQNISANLYDIIRQHIKKHNLGKLFFSPLDVIFEEGINRLQPDLLFIKKENSYIEQDWVRGVPDMVCEIISPGTYKKDTATKKKIYEKYKVPEYWIVIPELKTVEVLTIENDKYEQYSFAELEGVVNSKVIEGLKIDISEIFV